MMRFRAGRGAAAAGATSSCFTCVSRAKKKAAPASRSSAARYSPLIVRPDGSRGLFGGQRRRQCRGLPVLERCLQEAVAHEDARERRGPHVEAERRRTKRISKHGLRERRARRAALRELEGGRDALCGASSGKARVEPREP